MHERRKRKLRSCCKALLFVAFFWCLIYYGFQHQNVDLDFGEHLDNAHNERLRKSFQNPFHLKEVRNNKIDFCDSDEANEENSSASSKALSSHEEDILKEFLEEKTTTVKKFVLVTENRQNENRTEVTSDFFWKETTGDFGQFEDEYFQLGDVNNFYPEKIEMNLENKNVEQSDVNMQVVEPNLENPGNDDTELANKFLKLILTDDQIKKGVQELREEHLESNDNDTNNLAQPDADNVDAALQKLNPGNQPINVVKLDNSTAKIFGPEPEKTIEVDPTKKIESIEKNEPVKKVESTEKTEPIKKVETTEKIEPIKKVENSKKVEAHKKTESTKKVAPKKSSSTTKASETESSSSDSDTSESDAKASSSNGVDEHQDMSELFNAFMDPKNLENFKGDQFGDLFGDDQDDDDSDEDSSTDETLSSDDSDDSDYSVKNSLLGEYGEPVILPDPKKMPKEINEMIAEGWKNYEFNEYVSSLISTQRNLKDFRTEYCMVEKELYSKDLPEVSIIMVFYNEAWSTLIRSVYSVFDRSPPHLIKEVLLVDDFSEFNHLKEPLEAFMEQFPKVRILRNTKREGLIYSRNRGAQEAKAEVILFLDSHIECTAGWLEPLLDRIVLNSSAIAVPIINKINDTTFALLPLNQKSSLTLGGFHWDMHFHWFYVQKDLFTDPEAPVPSPTMAGGLFAINKNFFMKLGMFDPDLQVWGGENLELSFKAWMCGGKIEIAQCSHVGHVFRVKSPYSFDGNLTKIMRRNSMRVAKVWMDDYAVFFSYATGFDKVEYGDITDRVKLRESLKCNDFEWYLKNVYPQRTIPSEGISFGSIQNLGFGGQKCLSGYAERKSTDVKVKTCHGKGRDQFWMYDANGVIERDNYCLSFDDKKIFTKHCKASDDQLFTYDANKQQLLLKKFKKCLEMTKDFKLIMAKCATKEGQKWKLENLKKERLKKF